MQITMTTEQHMGKMVYGWVKVATNAFTHRIFFWNSMAWVSSRLPLATRVAACSICDNGAHQVEVKALHEIRRHSPRQRATNTGNPQVLRPTVTSMLSICSCWCASSVANSWNISWTSRMLAASISTSRARLCTSEYTCCTVSWAPSASSASLAKPVGLSVMRLSISSSVWPA